MRAPRYAKDDDELNALAGQARQWSCPHCGRRGTLNAHGALRGCAEDGPGKRTLRGRRFFCSNRGVRSGCGRTFSVLLATLLAGATVRTVRLWQFYRARCATGSVARAWAQLRSGFSVEVAYRWWHRWQAGQFRVRAWLQAARDPPESGRLLEHLAAVCGPADPLAAYQRACQEPWPATRPPPST